MTGFTNAEIDKENIENLAIKNIRNPYQNVFSSGQPSKQQLSALAKLGIKHIVNLRPAMEQDWDEAKYVASLDMVYHSIPVAGAEGITENNANSLQQTLTNIGNEPVLVHCASGNRVGALVALYKGLSTGDVDTSIALGQSWGLTGLEPVIRRILEQ